MRRGAALAWLMLGLLATMLLGDAWVDALTIPRAIRALSDPWIHGAVAAFMIAMIRVGRPAWPRWTILAGVAVAMAIDIDHAIAARSFDLLKMITLHMRPPTHSLTFALLAAAVTGAVTRSASWFSLVFVALASHVLRDAYTGVLLVFPFPATIMPYPLYIACELMLAALAAWLTPAAPPRFARPKS